MKSDLTRNTILLLLMLFATDVSAQEAAGALSESSQKSKTPDLSGIWAQKVVLTAVSDPPIVSNVTTETITYLRVEIDQKSAADIKLKTTACAVDIKSDFKRIRTIVPQAFVNALGTTSRKGKLLRSGEQFYLDVAPNVQVTGAQLRQPESENLPTKPDDFRVTDPDRDQKPGVTLGIEGLVDGKIYVVQRGKDTYRGKVDPAGKIRGKVRWESEQVVLDSTSIFLGDPPPTWPHKDASRSYFEMKRLKKDLSCAQIKASKDRLFR